MQYALQFHIKKQPYGVWKKINVRSVSIDFRIFNDLSITFPFVISPFVCMISRKSFLVFKSTHRSNLRVACHAENFDYGLDKKEVRTALICRCKKLRGLFFRYVFWSVDRDQMLDGVLFRGVTRGRKKSQGARFRYIFTHLVLGFLTIADSQTSFSKKPLLLWILLMSVENKGPKLSGLPEFGSDPLFCCIFVETLPYVLSLALWIFLPPTTKLSSYVSRTIVLVFGI